MQDPTITDTGRAAASTMRDFVDIALASALTVVSAIGGWGGKRLMRTIDGKLDKDVFDQHVEDVTNRIDDALRRSTQDRVDMKEEMRSVNEKLDRMIGYMIEGRQRHGD